MQTKAVGHKYTDTSHVFIPILHMCNSANALTWKNTFPRINLESASL